MDFVQKQDNLNNDKILTVDNIKTLIQDEQTIATFFVPLILILLLYWRIFITAR